jgi:hypothetical protein
MREQHPGDPGFRILALERAAADLAFLFLFLFVFTVPVF